MFYLSTAYLPNIQYFSKILSSDRICFETNENFPKQTYRNRCKIATVNGVLQLSIPVIRARTHKTPIKEVKIDYTEDWIIKHINALTSSYRSTPYFEFYKDEIFDVLLNEERYLFDLNIKLTLLIMKQIGFKREFVFTNEFELSYPKNDFRNSIHPKKKHNVADDNFNLQNYYQNFSDKNGFIPNLSIVDLLFNEGPLSYSILRKSIKSIIA